MSETRYIRVFFFSFQKKIFFLVWTDRQFAKDMHACCFNNYTTTIVFFFFSDMHNSWPKPELKESETFIIGMYAFMIISLLIYKNRFEIFHTNVEKYIQ